MYCPSARRHLTRERVNRSRRYCFSISAIDNVDFERGRPPSHSPCLSLFLTRNERARPNSRRNFTRGHLLPALGRELNSIYFSTRLRIFNYKFDWARWIAQSDDGGHSCAIPRSQNEDSTIESAQDSISDATC